MCWRRARSDAALPPPPASRRCTSSEVALSSRHPLRKINLHRRFNQTGRAWIGFTGTLKWFAAEPFPPNGSLLCPPVQRARTGHQERLYVGDRLRTKIRLLFQAAQESLFQL